MFLKCFPRTGGDVLKHIKCEIEGNKYFDDEEIFKLLGIQKVFFLCVHIEHFMISVWMMSALL